MADFNIFGTAPESLAGLLGEQATKDLQRKAMTTGLINTALGYLVQPKNQNLGLGRIIGQSLMSGMTGAQGVYTGALEDWQTKQKIAELQRKNALQEKVQGMIGGITDPNEQLYAQLSPEQYVAGKVKPQKAFNILTPEQSASYGLPTDKGQKYQMTDSGVSLIGGTEAKDIESWSDPYQLGGQTVQKNNVTGQIRQAVTLPSTTNVTYGAPVSGVDAQGNPVFFQPSKGGGAPAIIPGVTPPQAKPAEAITKQVTGIDNLQSAINNYREKLKTWKPQDAVDPNKRATMTTTYNNMMLQAKEAYGLGVLNGPDYSILTDTIADPVSAKGLVYGATGGLDQQAKTLDDLMTNMKKTIQKSQKIMPKNEQMPIARRKFNPVTGRIE